MKYYSVVVKSYEYSDVLMTKIIKSHCSYEEAQEIAKSLNDKFYEYQYQDSHKVSLEYWASVSEEDERYALMPSQLSVGIITPLPLFIVKRLFKYSLRSIDLPGYPDDVSKSVVTYLVNADDYTPYLSESLFSSSYENILSPTQEMLDDLRQGKQKTIIYTREIDFYVLGSEEKHFDKDLLKVEEIKEITKSFEEMSAEEKILVKIFGIAKNTYYRTKIDIAVSTDVEEVEKLASF